MQAGKARPQQLVCNAAGPRRGPEARGTGDGSREQAARHDAHLLSSAIPVTSSCSSGAGRGGVHGNSAWRRGPLALGCPTESPSWPGGPCLRSRPEMWLLAVEGGFPYWPVAAAAAAWAVIGVVAAIAARCPAHAAGLRASGPRRSWGAGPPAVARFGIMVLATQALFFFQLIAER